jgi:D-proline reductase (dithiol) PrdB
MKEASTEFSGYRFLPPSLRAWIKLYVENGSHDGNIPWTKLPGALKDLTFSMVTSAGINHKSDPPFDMEYEKEHPTYGDPSYRAIPRNTKSSEIDVNHLHINTDYIKEDINVILPLERMTEFEAEGIIGRLAPTSYSFYGFQLESNEFLTTAISPMADKMKEEEVEAVLLTPA